MSDNEKRAHDLTMLYIQETFRLKVSSAESDSVIPANFVNDYIKLYPEILNAINDKLK